MALCLLVFSACGDDGGGSSIDAGVQGSCFYSCNTNLGTLYGCSSNAAITSSATCSSEAQAKCDSSGVGQSEFLSTCERCDSSCAPEWHES
jgi:hypothetical protein